MPKLFAQNITTAGRVLRGSIGMVLLLGGIYALPQVLWLGVILLASAGFVLFESLRGWCVMRACGIKTRL